MPQVRSLPRKPVFIFHHPSRLTRRTPKPTRFRGGRWSSRS